MVYHQPKGLYIIAEGVYHHAKRVLLTPSQAADRTIEVIGYSITAGFGNLVTDGVGVGSHPTIATYEKAGIVLADFIAEVKGW